MEAETVDGDAATSRAGFVRGLFLGEFRDGLVFPYSGPLDPGDVAERLAELSRAAGPAGDGPSFDRVIRAARRAELAKAQLSEAVRGVRADARLITSTRAAAVLARLAAAVYALEAATFTAAGWLDRGCEGPALETAFLEPLFDAVVAPAVFDAIRTHEPLGRAFLDEPRLGAEAVDALATSGAPVLDHGGLWAMLRRRLIRSATAPHAPVVTPMLRPFAEALGRRTSTFGRVVDRVQGSHDARHRIALAAVELTASACMLARLDATAAAGKAGPDEHAIAELALHESGRRFDALAAPRDPDREAVRAGRAVLRGAFGG